MSLLNTTNNMQENKKTKEEHVRDLCKAIRAVNEQMEPFKAHLKDLKRDYVENGWLTKTELKTLLQAYKLVQNDEDVEKIVEMVNAIKG